MEIYPEEGKIMTSVSIPISIRQEIKRRGMTLAGCMLLGIKAADEKLSWNAEKEAELAELRAYRLAVIKDRYSKRKLE